MRVVCLLLQVANSKMLPTLPNNVISFVRKMSAWTLETTSSSEQEKSKMTKLKESFIGKPVKKDIANMSHLTPDELLTIRRVEQRRAEDEAGCSFIRNQDGADLGKQCRICLRRLRDIDVFKTCCECQRYMCDGCGFHKSEDYPGSVECTVCHRKKQPIKVSPPTEQDSSPQEVPTLDIPLQHLSLSRKRSRELDYTKHSEPEAAISRQHDYTKHSEPEATISRQHEIKAYVYAQSRTPSQEEEEEMYKDRRPSAVRSERSGLGSRTSTEENDPGQGLLEVPMCITVRRSSDTGPTRITIPIPEQSRRLSDTGPDRGRLATADRERRLSEFLATWTGKLPGDRRLSEAGAPMWGERAVGKFGGRRMSEAAWTKMPEPLLLDKRPVDSRLLDKRPAEVRSMDPSKKDPRRQLESGRNKWSLDSKLCPPPKDPRERRSSEGLAAPSRERERRASDVGPNRNDVKVPTMSHALSNNIQDTQARSVSEESSASHSSGPEDYYEDNGRRRSKKVKKKTRVQRQRSGNYGFDSRSTRHNWSTATPASQERLPRQYSKDRAMWKQSSGSSELSDNGPELMGPPPIPPRRDSQPQIQHFHSSQRSIHKPKILIQKTDASGYVDSSPSPDGHNGRITLARRMSRGDTRTVYSDCEAMHDEVDKEKMELQKPRHSWPEVEVNNVFQTLDVMHAKAPLGGYLMPRQSGGLRTSESYGEYDQIQIVVHDVDNGDSKRGRVKSLILHRDAEDVHRTCGLGMRVIGGKTGTGGHLWTYVVETMPDGPAEKIGIVEGDRILAWDGESLVDRTFEEVNSIIDQSGDVIELMVEQRSNDLMRNPDTYLTDNHPTTLSDTLPKGTRRKLPKTPHELYKRVVSGQIQLQIWFRKNLNDLVVNVLDARNLRKRSDKTLPQAYVKVRLLPVSEKSYFKTAVAEPTCNPSWNIKQEFVFPLANGIDIADCSLNITVWDYRPGNDKPAEFLGETHINLTEVDLDHIGVWYKLEEHRNRRSHQDIARKSRESIGRRRSSMRRTDFQNSRSLSDERDGKDDASLGSMVKSTSADWSAALHPDYGSERRRSSSGSEKERLQVNNQKSTLSTGGSPTRMRSKSLRVGKHETAPSGSEQRRKFSQRVKKFSRSLSLKSEKRSVNIGSDTSSQLESGHGDWSRDFLTSPPVAIGSKWQVTKDVGDDGSDDGNNLRDQNPSTESDTAIVTLGPGQVTPRGLYMTSRPEEQSCGEIHLGIILTKGQLEVDVIAARDLPKFANQAPDTYVKTYLKEMGDLKKQKRKTRVIRQSTNPQYCQILRYDGCDVLGRSIVVMVWQKKGFNKQGIGMAQIELKELTLYQLTRAWYRLFPMSKHTSDSDSA